MNGDEQEKKGEKKRDGGNEKRNKRKRPKSQGEEINVYRVVVDSSFTDIQSSTKKKRGVYPCGHRALR